MTDLEKIIMVNKNKRYNYNALSNNPNISFKFIKENIYLDWNFSIISKHQELDMNFVLRSIIPEMVYNWNLDQICRNHRFNLNYIEIFNQIPWNFKYLSMNPNFNIEFIRKYQDRNLYWEYISYTINPELVIENNDINIINERSIIYFSLNPKIDKYFISKYNIEYYYPSLCANESIDIESVINYGKERNIIIDDELWKIISSRKNLPIKFIENNVSNIDFSIISHNKGIKINFILKYKEKNFNYTYLSSNESINIYDIIEHKNLNWNWNVISERLDCSYKIIKNNPDIKWNKYKLLTGNINIKYKHFKELCEKDNEELYYYYYSINPNLTSEIVLNNKDDKWDYDQISKNLFKKDKRLIIRSSIIIKRYIIKKIIIKRLKKISKWYKVMINRNIPNEIINEIMTYL